MLVKRKRGGCKTTDKRRKPWLGSCSLTPKPAKTSFEFWTETKGPRSVRKESRWKVQPSRRLIYFILRPLPMTTRRHCAGVSRQKWLRKSLKYKREWAMNMYRHIGKLNAYVICNPIHTKPSTAASAHAFGGAIPHVCGTEINIPTL